MDRAAGIATKIGCTVGVIRASGGILFFKNRDLSRTYLIDRITTWESTPHHHALRGADLCTSRPQGVSIGVNRYQICVANTHVVTTKDPTYDLLCEEILYHARCKKDVPQVVAEYMGRNRVQGGRILVASPRWVLLVEVYKSEYALREVEPDTVITNTFSLLERESGQSKVREDSSASRLKVAQAMAKEISTIGALKAMLRSHEPEKGELSICNHRQDGGGTESSHIIQIQGDRTTWISSTGFPCESDYHSLPLQLERQVFPFTR
jgi:hypothetical protein